MYMDDIEQFGKNGNEQDTNDKNIQPGYRIEFGIEKCSMLIMKPEKKRSN